MSGQIVDDFLCDIADGAHSDDDAVSIGSAVVVEELVIGAELGIDLAHVLLDYCGDCLIVLVGSFTVLEEDIAVFMGAAHYGVLGVQRSVSECLDGVHVDHVLEIVIIPDLDLLQLVRGAETVEEVEERNSALDSREVCDRGQVHDFLNVGLGQHRETGLAASHNVAVVTEDVQGVACEGTCADVEHAGQQLACDLVHVGDHQEQALGCGVSGGQSACVQRTVDRTSGAGLCLHFLNLYSRAEYIFTACRTPLVHEICHRAGRCNGVDCCNFSKRVGYMGGRVVAVHCLEVSLH